MSVCIDGSSSWRRKYIWKHCHRPRPIRLNIWFDKGFWQPEHDLCDMKAQNDSEHQALLLELLSPCNTRNRTRAGAKPEPGPEWTDINLRLDIAAGRGHL